MFITTEDGSFNKTIEEPSKIRRIMDIALGIEETPQPVEKHVVYRKAQPRANKKWSKEEDSILINEFTQGTKIPKIAKALARSAKACEVRLYVHGLIGPKREKVPTQQGLELEGKGGRYDKP